MYKTSRSFYHQNHKGTRRLRRGLRHKHPDLYYNPSYCPSRSNLSQADLSSSDRNSGPDLLWAQAGGSADGRRLQSARRDANPRAASRVSRVSLVGGGVNGGVTLTCLHTIMSSTHSSTTTSPPLHYIIRLVSHHYKEATAAGAAVSSS
jgi:hypothetical protein